MILACADTVRKTHANIINKLNEHGRERDVER